MALPNCKDSHANYTQQLAYFCARLAADPETEALAVEIDEVLRGLDEAHRQWIEARRAEVCARAARDHLDARVDVEIKKYQRRLSMIEDAAFFVRCLFPGGLGRGSALRGREQIDRLRLLQARTQDMLASAVLASHAEAAELRVALEHGRGVLAETIGALVSAFDEWEARAREAARAGEAYESRRTDAAARVGPMLGQLRGSLAASVYADLAPSLGQGADGEIEALLSEDAAFDEASRISAAALHWGDVGAS